MISHLIKLIYDIDIDKQYWNDVEIDCWNTWNWCWCLQKVTSYITEGSKHLYMDTQDISFTVLYMNCIFTVYLLYILYIIIIAGSASLMVIWVFQFN